jgi:hypothetical protein
MADGRTLWNGVRYVDEVGEREGSVKPEAAARLIDQTAARLQPLRRRKCGVDHTHYVEIEIGRAGQADTEFVRGCGERFFRVARPIDRAAGTRRWR